MGRISSTNAGEAECIQATGGKASRKQTIRKTHNVGGQIILIKVDFRNIL
jgi:hypothetical protein